MTDHTPINATCHCGNIRIALSEKPLILTECNCSLCSRYGGLWAYYTPDTAFVHANQEMLVSYQWGDRKICFFHCKICGCVTHYTSTGRIAINARNLEPEVVKQLPIQLFDGADSWTVIKPADSK